MGMALMKAQMENIQADTQKKKAEADNIGADTTYKGLTIEYQKLENEIKNRTLEDSINIIEDAAREAYARATIEQAKEGIISNTQEAQIAKIQREADMLLIQKAAIVQGIALDKARVEQIAKDIEARFEEIKVSREGQDISRENMEKLTETMLWSVTLAQLLNFMRLFFCTRNNSDRRYVFVTFLVFD